MDEQGIEYIIQGYEAGKRSTYQSKHYLALICAAINRKDYKEAEGLMQAIVSNFPDVMDIGLFHELGKIHKGEEG